MPKLPVSPMKVASAVGEVRSIAESGGRLLVLGTNAESVERVRSALAGDSEARGGRPPVESIVFAEGGLFPREAFSDSVSTVVMVSSAGELSSNGLRDSLVEMARKDKPAVVVLSEAPGVEMSFPGVGPKRVVGMSMDGMPPADVLAEAIVDAAGDEAIGLAAKLPVLRAEACRQIVRKTARQNGVIGTLFFLPGADMPVMTLNEAKMVLQLAAAHGEPVGTERAIELLGVLGAGFGLRGVARQALSLMPGPGWAIKGAVAYGGTKALGSAARKYFDGSKRLTPSRLAPLVDKIRQLRG